MSLPAIQERLQAFLLRRERDIEQHVVGTTRVPVATRLGIYGDAYRVRLTEALASNYPALVKLLGEADFAALSAAYIETHVSRWPSIRHYGAELAQFLTTAELYCDVAVLAELAAWEWAMTEVFDAADENALGVAALTSVSPEDWAGLRFDFHPAIRRLDLQWNVPQSWKALTGGGERPQAVLGARTQPWLLWRHQLQILFRSLAQDEAVAFDVLRAGATFGDACLALCEQLTAEQAPIRAATALRSWTESGLIVGVQRQTLRM
jgi:hypothetical protein